MICEVCGKEIARGQKYKSEKYKSKNFCSEECYNKKLEQMKVKDNKKEKIEEKPKEQPDNSRRMLTDYIQDWWSYRPNWSWIMLQVKNIMNDYNLNYKQMYLVLKYCREYEQIELDESYGLYQFFPKYIEPTKDFYKQICKHKQQAKDMPTEESIVIVSTSKNNFRKWKER